MVWKGDSDSRSGPTESGLWLKFPSSVPHLAWDSRKETFFLAFFFPFLPNFGDGHAPGDIIAFLGEGHVAPRP